MSEERISYYKKRLPDLVEKMKTSANQLLEIIAQDINDELSDDKLHNVIKAKRMASEDVIWIFKRVDELENEINGTEKTEEELEEELNEGLHPSKRFAKKK